MEILEYIRSHENITLIKGNHEQFLLEYVEENESWDWLQNGGEKTLRLFNEKSYEQQQFIYNYLKTRPKYIIIDDKYILSHAGIYIPPLGDKYEIDELVDMLGDNFLWHRYIVDKEKKYRHYIQIVGHNRVQSIAEGQDKILKRDGVIYIDCGAELRDGKLACLRIDDMEEFYV